MPKVSCALVLNYFNSITHTSLPPHPHLRLLQPCSRRSHLTPPSSSPQSKLSLLADHPRLPLSVLAIIASAFVATRIITWPKNLFLYHPTLAATIAPLATTATIAVRARVSAARAAGPRGGKSALKRCVKLHFALSALATVAALGSVGAIFVNKIRLGKPHFVSIHAKSGVVALALWLAALFVAETRVWADGLPWWRHGRFDYSPRWIWASKTHRRLGTAAYAAMLIAIASGVGLTPYGQQLGARAAIIASLGATGVTMAI